jgi:hypothetical protein
MVLHRRPRTLKERRNAMGIFQDLEKVGKEIEHDVEQIGATIEKDLQKAADAVKEGLAKGEELLEKGLEDEEKALIKGIVTYVQKKYADSIGQLRSLGNQGIKSADTTAIRNDVAAAFEQADSDAARAVISNLQTTPVQNAMNGIHDDFEAIALYALGEVDLGVGTALLVGGAADRATVSAPGGDLSGARMLMDFDLSIGAEEGAEAGLALGLWTKKPKDLQEGFLAVALEADVGLGSGIILYLSLSMKPEFVGLAMVLTGGEELEAGVALGFTLSFKLP